MKTKLCISALCLLAVCSFTFSSCDDEKGDVTKPVIDLHEPEEGEQLKIGSDVHFDMELSDDVMLASYKINIHSNFDHHSHGTARANDKTVAFTFEKSYAISGKKNEHVHHHDIVIPANATPGDYHLMVYCTDAAGNEKYITRNIKLSTTAPDHEHHD